MHGRPDCVQLLLDANAAVDSLTNHEGQTPLFKACYGGRRDCAQLLLDANAAIIAEAAAAAAEARKGDVVDAEEAVWKEYGGARLEAALATDAAHNESAVRLVDARFLIELHKRGGLLRRRQELPHAAAEPRFPLFQRPSHRPIDPAIDP